MPEDQPPAMPESAPESEPEPEPEAEAVPEQEAAPVIPSPEPEPEEISIKSEGDAETDPEKEGERVEPLEKAPTIPPEDPPKRVSIVSVVEDTESLYRAHTLHPASPPTEDEALEILDRAPTLPHETPTSPIKSDPESLVGDLPVLSEIKRRQSSAVTSRQPSRTPTIKRAETLPTPSRSSTVSTARTLVSPPQEAPILVLTKPDRQPTVVYLPDQQASIVSLEERKASIVSERKPSMTSVVPTVNESRASVVPFEKEEKRTSLQVEAPESTKVVVILPRKRDKVRNAAIPDVALRVLLGRRAAAVVRPILENAAKPTPGKHPEQATNAGWTLYSASDGQSESKQAGSQQLRALSAQVCSQCGHEDHLMNEKPTTICHEPPKPKKSSRRTSTFSVISRLGSLKSRSFFQRRKSAKASWGGRNKSGNIQPSSHVRARERRAQSKRKESPVILGLESFSRCDLPGKQQSSRKYNLPSSMMSSISSQRARGHVRECSQTESEILEDIARKIDYIRESNQKRSRKGIDGSRYDYRDNHADRSVDAAQSSLRAQKKKDRTGSSRVSGHRKDAVSSAQSLNSLPSKETVHVTKLPTPFDGRGKRRKEQKESADSEASATTVLAFERLHNWDCEPFLDPDGWT